MFSTLFNFIKKNNTETYEFAPYSINIYKSLINSFIADPLINLCNFSETKTSGFQKNIFFRHDIDLQKCVEMAPLLIEFDLKSNISSPCFLRVDETEYSMKSARKLVDEFKPKGVEFGLHTICYAHDQYFDFFRDETKKFEDNFGFSPNLFTVHGLGTRRKKIRLEFYEKVVGRLEEFGYSFSDCSHKLRRYDHVIEDCHWSETEGKRYILNDFDHSNKIIAHKTSVLLLTHPCYWKDEE